MRIKRSARFHVCKKIFITRKMVIPRTWIRKEVEFYSRIQTTRRMRQSRRIDDDGTLRKRTPSFFRATSPLSRGTLNFKRRHFCADQGTIETVFRTIISANQLSNYGAVSNLCEECKTCHVRTGRPVLAGQSDPLFVPSVMKTRTPLTDGLSRLSQQIV